MDVRTEFDVFNRFRQLLDGRTAILISHRFSTVRMADRIFVFDQGRIVERGTHTELVAMAGLYAGMFEQQAMQYQ
jgi:ATP-binding cassette subfamily B protein